MVHYNLGGKEISSLKNYFDYEAYFSKGNKKEKEFGQVPMTKG